jgi:hypothetical protein
MEPQLAPGNLSGMAPSIGNPNRQGPFGNTLLHSAVASGDISEVQRLLAAGANPGIANREGHTAARIAVLIGREDIRQMLSDPRDAHVEHLLDEALKETFPASDPIAVTPKR